MEAIKRPLLFETTDDGLVDDERTAWYPQFKKLSQMEMTYVAWITDYNSPLYSQPIDRGRYCYKIGYRLGCYAVQRNTV
jgi:hypothetical protein